MSFDRKPSLILPVAVSKRRRGFVGTEPYLVTGFLAATGALLLTHALLRHGTMTMEAWAGVVLMLPFAFFCGLVGLMVAKEWRGPSRNRPPSRPNESPP